MPQTRSAYLDDLKHVLRVVLQFPADGEVEKSLINEGYVSLDDFLSMTNEDLDDFDVVLDDTTHRFLHKPEKGKVQAFQSFVIWRGSEGLPIAEDEWQSITFDEFHHYCLSPEFIAVRIGVRPPPGPSSSSPGKSLVTEFRRGIKRDMILFPTLKDDKAWDGWRRATIAQARAQIVEEVLNPTYTPSSVEIRELFDEKQKYMYAVFERNLLTDIGKSIVRKYATTGNAQKVFRDLSDYYEKSTKAAMDSGELLTYITSAKFNDGNWKGTAHGFILHWQDQVRKYESLIPKGDWF